MLGRVPDAAGSERIPFGQRRPVIGVVGLGLIGGSLAAAYQDSGWCILGLDTDEAVLQEAIDSGDIEDRLSVERMADCDLIWIALYPQAVIDFVQKHLADIGSDTLVVDCCGVKQNIMKTCQPPALAAGRIFIGGHPMAGRHFSGFHHRRADLFKGASMILVTGEQPYPPELRSRLESLLQPAGFGTLVYTDAAKHDAIIAFTSQLAHIVSNAYVKSPTALEHTGYSAGSYRDLTRVAWLNEDMWTLLFMENREALLTELHYLTESLQAYERALREQDAVTLRQLLAEGKQRKKEVDGNYDTDRD
ncbi:MAG: prephenate dehydrogenase [Lachnospiraceae bacterium]|nr:prephenate dehydrogenase [Lachnospiraceae bacterium]MDY5741731.1 prephenate dehydrogenase [Lachnospiraceae bacterium]